MKRNDKLRLKKMREGDRRESMKEEGNVHLPPNKVQTPKPKREKHAPKRIRYYEDEDEYESPFSDEEYIAGINENAY